MGQFSISSQQKDCHSRWVNFAVLLGNGKIVAFLFLLVTLHQSLSVLGVGEKEYR